MALQALKCRELLALEIPGLKSQLYDQRPPKKSDNHAPLTKSHNQIWFVSSDFPKNFAQEVKRSTLIRLFFLFPAGSLATAPTSSTGRQRPQCPSRVPPKVHLSQRVPTEAIPCSFADLPLRLWISLPSARISDTHRTNFVSAPISLL